MASLPCSICQDLKSISFKQLVLWEKPRATGAVVGGIVTLLMIFGFFEYTLVTFVCRVLELCLAVVGVMVSQKWIDVTADDVKKRVRVLISDVEPFVVSGIEQLFRVITWEDKIFSLKVFLASFVAALLGNILSDLVFVMMATVVVFVVPAAYVHNKSVIDPQLQRASKTLDQYVSSIKPKTA